MKLSFSIKFTSFVLLVALVGLVHNSESFTAPSAISSRACGSKLPTNGLPLSSPSLSGFVESRPSTELQVKKNDISSEERGSDNVNSLIGLDRGVYLQAIAVAICIWFFTIPVEFRRTKFCSEEQTRANPEVCMTAKQFSSGIADYYKNGGGIKFDFSIESKE